MKINKKKLAMFALPILAIGMVVAVLTYYAVFSVTVNVTNPITITGDATQLVPCNSGETCIGDQIKVENSGLERTITISDNSIPEIEVNYVGKLELENKNSNWEVISDGTQGTLYYSIVGDVMKYHLEAEGLSDIDYTLIYYADDDPRFSNWGGNPAKEIDSGTASSGELTLEGETNIGNLPFATDWNNINNINWSKNYCNGNNGFDYYEHCTNAKIWLITSSDYDGIDEELTAWNPSNYLFETDLIKYFNNSNGEYVIGQNSFIEFYPLFEIDPYLPTGNYSVDITIA